MPFECPSVRQELAVRRAKVQLSAVVAGNRRHEFVHKIPVALRVNAPVKGIEAQVVVGPQQQSVPYAELGQLPIAADLVDLALPKGKGHYVGCCKSGCLGLATDYAPRISRE